MAGKSILDAIYTYRFLRLLSMKWEDTDAYKLGIIDKDGNPLKKSKDLKTNEEKKAYTSFIRLVFKFKRMLSAIPAGKSAVVRYGAALALIKESTTELNEMKIDINTLRDHLQRLINEEVTTTTDGVAGKEQPLGKDKKPAKRCPDKKCNTDEIDVKENAVYQLIGTHLIRVDEKKHVIKRRIRNGKRVKRREVQTGKGSRFTRTGKRKLRGGAKTRFKHRHKKAYRKAHTASAEAKRRRSMRKRKVYAK